MTSDEFTTAVEQYSRSIRNLLMKRGANYSDAEEITQETWFRAWAHRHQWRGDNLKAWLFKIAVNMQCKRWRLQSRLCELPTDKQFVQATSHRRLFYTENFDSCIDAQQILSRCSPRSVQLLHGAYFEGQRANGVGLLRMRLFRALQEAREVAQQRVKAA